MRPAPLSGCLLVATLASCASAPPATPAAPDEGHGDHVLAEGDASTDAPLTVTLPPPPARPASSATYEEAIGVPEALDVNDDRTQLTDGQLTGPMRGVLSTCRVPSNGKVTIKTAVQNGRAIGVTITVVFEHPRSVKRLSPATVRAEAKLSAKIVTCADRAVRAVTWPPSRRRDSFTTVF